MDPWPCFLFLGSASVGLVATRIWYLENMDQTCYWPASCFIVSDCLLPDSRLSGVVIDGEFSVGVIIHRLSDMALRHR